jgi:hypothetical protein
MRPFLAYTSRCCEGVTGGWSFGWAPIRLGDAHTRGLSKNQDAFPFLAWGEMLSSMNNTNCWARFQADGQ